MRITPPSWVRHFVPWRLLWLIEEHTDVCRPRLVGWKLGHKTRTWWPSSLCFRDRDYCQKFDRHNRPLPETDEGPLLIWKDNGGREN